MVSRKQIPLAERMRPETLERFTGQEHLLGKDKVLRNIIESGNLQSMIFWGPPGSGKTTLAKLMAGQLKLPFKQLSAIQAGVKDIRNIIEEAASSTIVLFLDEIHRFNKSQQDALLGAVENGTLILIGATTENPSFEVNSALLSRCQVYSLHALTDEQLESILTDTLEKDTELKQLEISIKEKNALLRLSGGDARKLLNLLELVVNSKSSEKQIEVTDAVVIQVAQQKIARYDKAGEQHYDIISAFIKSVRGSDPNAALYWLARMIAGGEDPKFIARRLLILASEDIGNANPTAMIMANNCFQAVNVIGYPECRLILSQTTVYLACSPKSNASYKAMNDAERLVKETGDLEVPLALRNAPTKLMKEIGYGLDYIYPHDFPGNFKEQEYMPDKLKGRKIYEPGKNKREEDFRAFLKNLWKKYRY